MAVATACLAIVFISNPTVQSILQINPMRYHQVQLGCSPPMPCLVRAKSHHSCSQPNSNTRRFPTKLKYDLRDEIENSAQRSAYDRRSRGEGIGETAAGAIFGGLLGGPFGALFGAQIGASFGAARTVEKARMEEMRRKGLTPEMLEMANEVGILLEQAVEGLCAARNSLETSQIFAKKLEEQLGLLYERAKNMMESGDIENARKILMERERLKEKLVKVLRALAEDRKRLLVMENNVESLEMRGLEIESLLKRSVGASLSNASMSEFALELEDPLLKKFRDLGV